MAIAIRLTIEDFEALPDALAVGHELVNGELVPVAANKAKHNMVHDCLSWKLYGYVEQRGLGVVIDGQDFEFEGNAHAPDSAFVKAERRYLFDPDRRVQPFQPDLAIEILSDNDRFEEVMEKADRYRRSGTPEVWVFSLRTRKAFLLSSKGNAILEDDAEFRPEAIPGFSMRISDIFDLKG